MSSLLLLCSLASRQLYTSVDWTQPQYYSTSRVVSVGDYVVYVTRGPDGLLISAFDVTVQKWVVSKEFSWMDDGNGWDFPMFYETIHVKAIGQRAYIYARATFSSTLVAFDVTTFSLISLPPFPYLASNTGFTNPAHYRTIRAGVVGSSLYIAARDNAGVHLAVFNTLTATWTLLPTLAQLLSDAVWTQEQYYRTFQVVGEGTTLWFMIRGAAGLYIFSFNTVTLLWSYSSTPAYPVFDDAGGWGGACYYEVFQMVPYAGGFCIATRSIGGLNTIIYKASTPSFLQTGYPHYPDSAGWCSSEYHRTIKATACGTKVLTTGRGVWTVLVVNYDTLTNTWETMVARAKFTNAEHWDEIYRYTGLLEVCVGGWLYAVGRDMDDLKMERLSVSGNTWESVETITSLTCHPTCQVCFSPAATACTYCRPFAYLSGLSPTSCVCNSGYFPNPHAGSCSPCHFSCLECSGASDQLCTMCFSNASYSAISLPCACRCDSGYFPNPNESNCSKCSLTCLECSGERANQCSACKVYASLVNNHCICAEGYYMDTLVGECYQCDTQCKGCSGPLSTHCTTCFYAAELTFSNTCECRNEYFPSPDASHCLPCPPLCNYCQSTQICVSCKPHAYLHQGLCRCSDGYYENPPTIQCQLCSEGCVSCILTGCLRCISSLNLYQGACIQVCPSDMVVVDNSCEEAPPEPRLSVFPNNTVELSFTKPLSRLVETTDIAIQVSDGYMTYMPNWNMSALVEMTSYAIDLAFQGSTAPTDYSNVLLIFNDPSSLQDCKGRVISKSSLTASFNPFPASPLFPSSPSLAQNSSAAQQASTTMQGALTLALTSSFFTGSPTLLLSLFNQLQLVTYIPLMNVELPNTFGNTLLGLSVNGFSFNPLSYLYDSVKSPVPPLFALSYGFETSLFLLNSSSLILSFASVLLSFIPIAFLSRISTQFNYYFVHLAGKYHWGIPLRIWLQVYLDVGISGLLQFYDYSWSQYGARENGVLAGVCLCLFFLTPVLLLVFVVRNREKMLSRSDPEFNSRWGALYEEFRSTSGLPSIAFYGYFVVRRCVYGMVLICSHSHPTFQLFSSLTASLLVQLIQMFFYCASFCPYIDGFSEVGALWSEGSTIVIFVVAASFLWTSVTSVLGESLGTVGVWVVYVSIAGNAVLSIVQTIKTWKELVRRFARIMEKVRKDREDTTGRSIQPVARVS